MIRSREVFSPLLEHALVANRVLSCLKQLPTRNEETRQALEDSISFLRRMRQGHDIANSMTISDNSYQDALAYAEGVKAFRLSAPADPEPDSVKLIQLMEETATAMRDGKDVSDNALSTFQSFFTAVRDLTLKAGSKPLEQVRY